MDRLPQHADLSNLMISKSLSFLVGAAFVALIGTLIVAGTRGSELEDICRPGYARSHRLPPAEYYPIARAAYERAGIPWSERAGFTLDHRRPICLGADWSQDNLQIQPKAEAEIKDRLEIRACQRVCGGTISLGEARAWFSNWKASYRREFGEEPARSR